MLEGRIGTRMHRDFEIRGFVYTSHGLIESRVRQTSSFGNVQQIRVRDGASYREDLWLQSRTTSDNRRLRGDTLLSEDRTEVSYPLELHYLGIGRQYEGDVSYCTALAGGSVGVDQRRHAHVLHRHHGMPDYTTRLREEFFGNRRVDADTGVSSRWQAAHAYRFDDNRGSCYQKTVLTQQGELDEEATGMDCPDGSSQVRWFAHPDGSPDTFSWLRP